MNAPQPIEPPGEPSAAFFPAGARATAVPSLLFSDVLPLIDDHAELLVTLYACYLTGRKPPGARWFTLAELRAEAPLMRAIARLPDGAAAALTRGLEAAEARRTVLHGRLQRDGRTLDVYTLSTAGAALMLARLGVRDAGPLPEPPEASLAVAANIFVLYEENIGVISPLLSERLREAEASYPWPWIETAFREAVSLNRRNWRYIERILERWQTEGPDLEAIGRTPEGTGRRSLAGRYWRQVRR